MIKSCGVPSGCWRPYRPNNTEIVGEVIAIKGAIGRVASQAKEVSTGILLHGDENKSRWFQHQTDAIENLKQLYYFVKRIAKVIAQEEPLYTAVTTAVPEREA